jgi:hypothetical protein
VLFNFGNNAPLRPEKSLMITYYIPPALAVALGALPLQALACATCLCGDPSITTMGVEKPFAGRLRASVEYLTRSETSGTPNVSEHTIEEQRITYALSYALRTDWMVGISIPLVTKQVSRYDLSEEQSSGLGDTDISARWFIGENQGFAARHLWGLHLGLRLPSSHEQEHQGDAIDFDAQAGAGATLAHLGGWHGYYRLPWLIYSSVTLQYSLSEGYQGYRAGTASLISTMTQYALTNTWAAQISLDGRWKQRDAYNGAPDENSGGTLVMLTPGLAWRPFTDWVINTSYQWPAIEDPNGQQTEDPNIRLGVAYDF